MGNPKRLSRGARPLVNNQIPRPVGPRPKPANDNWPKPANDNWKRIREFDLPSVAQDVLPYVPSLVRNLPARRAFELVELFDDIVYAYPRTGDIVANPARGWRLYGECANPMGPITHFNVRGWTSTPWHQAPLEYAEECLAGQAGVGTPLPVVVPNSNYLGLILFHGYEIAPGQLRYQFVRTYWRYEGNTSSEPHTIQEKTVVSCLPAVNPNFIRWMPTYRPGDNPEVADAPGQVLALAPTVRDRTMEATATSVRTQQRKHLREPPEKQTQEGKYSTRSRRFALALAKVMDGISEGSEVITSFYDALPEELRKQIEKARFPNARWIKDKRTGKWRKVGMDRPGDQYGQYGIEGADWKAQALWEHWDKVDMEAAMENLFKNYVEDKVIGGIHRKLPRNYGNANPEGDREFAKRLEELVDYVLENM